MRLARDDTREALAVAVAEAITGWGGPRLARAASDDATVRSDCWGAPSRSAGPMPGRGAASTPSPTRWRSSEPAGHALFPTVLLTSLGLATPFLRAATDKSARTRRVARRRHHHGADPRHRRRVGRPRARRHRCPAARRRPQAPRGHCRSRRHQHDAGDRRVRRRAVARRRSGSLDPSAPVLLADLVVPAADVDVVPIETRVAWLVARVGLAASLVGVADGALTLRFAARSDPPPDSVVPSAPSRREAPAGRRLLAIEAPAGSWTCSWRAATSTTTGWTTRRVPTLALASAGEAALRASRVPDAERSA